MVISFNDYGLHEQGIKPVESQGAKRKADSGGKDSLLHGYALQTM